LAAVALTAFAGGASEAAFLFVITRVAFAVTNEDVSVTLVADHSVEPVTAALIAALLVLARLGLAAMSTRLSARLMADAVASTRRQLAEAYLSASWPIQQSENAGGLQQLMGGYSSSVAGMLQGTTQGAVSGSALVALLALAILVNPIAALAALVVVVGLGLGLRPIRRAVWRRAHNDALQTMEFSTSVNELSQLGLELHVFDVHAQALARIRRNIDDLKATNRRVQFANGMVAPAYSGLAYLAIVAALLLASRFDSASIASLGVVMLLMLRSLGYGQHLQTAVAIVLANSPAVDELLRKLEDLKRGRRSDGVLSVGELGVLECRSISFGYTQDQPVLNDVSFDVQPNEIVGIVGPSGAGKSTLVELILGLRAPDQGEILAGARPVADFARADWARHVTFVPQRTRLIAGTVSDNIRFLRDNVSDEDVARAASLAHLDQVIEGFRDGYQRRIGEAGTELSGGQQQRLSIARALVERPDLLVLDEPTSALDVSSERLLRSTLLRLRSEMSIVIIAHRLSTLEVCDRILVIQNGEVMGFDSPERLSKGSEFYAESLRLSGLG
jgi:ABC-type multidrug transport system fused ATPase/permease subunit